MKHLHLDIETFSSVSLADCGVYRYTASPDFLILLIAYAFDDEPTRIIDLASGEDMPEWFHAALLDAGIVKHAHNATFERVCFTMLLRRLGRIAADDWLDPIQWRCSMVQCARCGLPLNLDQAGAVLGLAQQKMKEGKALIQLFCVPQESSGLFGSSSRVAPQDQPEKWETFKSYCIRDVEVERQIDAATAWYEVSDFEQALYAVDQRINDRGVRIDRQLATSAARMDALIKAHLIQDMQELTGLANPNSLQQLKTWLSKKTGRSFNTLNKTDVADLLQTVEDTSVRKVLALRAELCKTSNAKYTTMLDLMGEDDRARGLTQFYGSRTGRWAGRFIQMQNLPQNHIEALNAARAYLKDGDYVMLELGFGNVPATMSQLIRTAFIPKEGRIFAICDFSAIEARVLAWVAGEEWVLDVFRKGGDIYCETASQMFHVPVEKHGQNAHLRQKGKVAVLALGYQGGVGALDKMGGSRMGMTEQEKKDTVTKWRAANPAIVELWRDLEQAAKECIVYRTTRVVEKKYCRITFCLQENGTMTITLPSGRMICYPNATVPKVWKNTGRVNTPVVDGALKTYGVYRKETGTHLTFSGMNQITHKWETIETYGGKLTENLIQAIARDCLAEVMTSCEAKGYCPTFHVHDEIICEVDSRDKLEDIQRIFAKSPSWANGLPLKGAGYCTPYYIKD